MSIKSIISYDLAEIIRTGIGELDVIRKLESLDKEIQEAVRLCHKKDYVVLSDEYYGRVDELAEEIYEALFNRGEEDLLEKVCEKFTKKVK